MFLCLIVERRNSLSTTQMASNRQQYFVRIYLVLYLNLIEEPNTPLQQKHF